MMFQDFFSSLFTNFEEYKVCPPTSELPIPKLDIAPVTTICPNDLISSPITNDYLEKNHAIFEENGFFARADYRTPEEINYLIQPKCEGSNLAHYNVIEHRRFSDCSGFVSLTDNMKMMGYFGSQYVSTENTYYVYIAKMLQGLWIDPSFDLYPHESEHTAIGPVPVMSYRECVKLRAGVHHCGHIFIRSDLEPELKQKILAGQISSDQKATLVRPQQTISLSEQLSDSTCEKIDNSSIYPSMLVSFQNAALSSASLALLTDLLNNLLKRQNLSDKDRYWINYLACGLALLYLGASAISMLSTSVFIYLLEDYLNPTAVSLLTTTVALALNTLSSDSADLARVSMNIAGSVTGNYAYRWVKKGLSFFAEKLSNDTPEPERNGKTFVADSFST